jgi:UDP-galactopyranose mutase
MNVDLLVVGAGFSGAVMAERAASVLNKSVLVIDKRAHVAGNAHDSTDAHGVLLHCYGPHYFRTNSLRVFDYLQQFGRFRNVEYKILSWTNDKYWPFPINLNTFELLLGRPSSSGEMAATLEKWRVPIANPRNSEEVVLSQVGPQLYELFFKNYTRKQWRCDAAELDASVCGRIPIRTNRDNRYFNDQIQAIPTDGYTKLISRMLDHHKIRVSPETTLESVRGKVNFNYLVYTGPIDEYFGHRFGHLPYRSLRFEPETHAKAFYQPAVQVNYPNDFDYTRIIETKHITGQVLPVTTIMKEYPIDFSPGADPFYPIPNPASQAMYARYQELARAEKGVSFIGRLATYRYYNMDQVVGMALSEFDRIRSFI